MNIEKGSIILYGHIDKASTIVGAFAQACLYNLKNIEAASVVFNSTVAVGVSMSYHASVAMAKGAILRAN